MKLIIGIGNPGEDYAKTRHNVGHMFIDELRKQISNFRFPISNKLSIFKSDKFMNESGEFVSEKLKTYGIKPEVLYIVHDDLDISLEQYKIQFGKSPKDHNGIKSIDEALGTDQYWHVRIGIDNRPTDNRPMGEEYVLQNFSDEETVIIEKTIKEACKKLETLLKNTN